tara:strand:+ start:360 stop:899 length:540 start_codon:yes stop_codon:yes gene_type:complete
MENQKELEDKLWKIFVNVNDWLKIAEAKNAMLIGFNGACIFGLSRIMDITEGFLWWYLLFTCICFGFSVLTSLTAFVPRLNALPPGVFYDSKIINIFYFEYLKTLSSGSLIHELDERTKNFEIPSRVKQLADQVICNSNIASRKYSYFSVSVWITICGIASPLFGGLLFLYWYSHQLGS